MEANDTRSRISLPPPTHVHGLLPFVATAPSKIAPERMAELEALVHKHGIEIYVNDKGETDFKIGAMYCQIFTSMRVYHHLWSTALWFAALYIERHKAADEGKSEVNFDTPDMERVWANFLLSCKCLKDDSNYPPPPSAAEVTPREDFIILADDLFLKMVAFCILHEIAHVENGDSKTDEDGSPLNKMEPAQLELRADKWSYDWILSQWNQRSDEPKVFVNRTLGIIFALAMMDEFRHHVDNDFTSSHPDPCDRLLQFFNDYNEQIRSNEWGSTCLTAVFVGLQAIAVMNDFVLPTTGFSDAITFLNLAKVEIPRLAAEVKAKKAAYTGAKSQSKV
jgi:hypothetical protein